MMQVELIDQIEHFKNFKEDWDTAYLADPHATVFVSWPWIRGWIDTTNDRWLVLAVKVDKSSPYVAFLPLALRNVKTNRFFSVHQLHFAGTPTSDHKGFVCQPEYQDIAIKSMAIFIQKHISWDYLLAEEIWDPRFDDFLSEFSSLKYRIKERAATGCPYLPLPQSWDDYLLQMGHESRRDIRRALRISERLENFHVSHVRQDDFDNSVKIIDRLTWGVQPDQKWDSFRGKNITPQFRGCFESGLFWGVIFWHGQVPISAQNVFMDFRKGYIAGYNTGYDPDYAKFSPGKAIQSYTIRYAIENGFREFDFLRGNEGYKSTIFQAKERHNRNVMITNLRSPKVLGIQGMHKLTRWMSPS